MVQFRFASFAALCALSSASMANAQEATASEDSTIAQSAVAPPAAPPKARAADGSEILVIGNRIPDDKVREYITDMLFPERVGETKFYATLGDPLCPTVIGLEDASKSRVIQRMRTVAKVAGIEVAENENCSFNLVVALVEDGPETMKRWRARYHRTAFGFIPIHMRNTIQRSGGPSYAWHVIAPGGYAASNPVGTAGLFAGNTAFDGLNATLFPNGQVNPQIVIPLPEVIYASFVLIERDALKDVNATQLADYALMRGMMQVQIRQDASRNVDSILNLFETGLPAAARQPSLTRVDLAMLASLYSARHNVSAFRQRLDMIEPFQRVMAYGEAGIDP